MSAIFLLLLLMDKDELEQCAFNNALKISTVITILSVLGYGLYMSLSGYTQIHIHTLFCGIEGISILTLLLYYMDLKGITFEVKIKNERVANLLMYSSTIISVLATISLLFEFTFFENKIGFIRYDELILFTNIILISIIIPLLPKRKQLDRNEYKQLKKEIDKSFNILYAIYGILMLLIISYLVYQKVI